MLVSGLVCGTGTVANGIVAGNYFSFPSFEDFLEFEESEERIDGRQENGVP